MGGVSMQALQQALDSKQNVVLTLNTVVSVFLFASFIISFVSAADAPSGGLGRAVGFIAIWNVLIILAVNVGTFFALKKRPTADMIAYVTASTAMLVLQTLGLAVLFGGLDSVFSHASFRAFSVFSVFLMLVYIAMLYFLVRHRDAMVQDIGAPSKADDDGNFDPAAVTHGGHAPPSQAAEDAVYAPPSSDV